MAEFPVELQRPGGAEGGRCKHAWRLDTYRCGCQHNCSYCYAKGLLEFRKLWSPEAPKVANLARLEKQLAKVPAGEVVRLGGLTDCFQPLEAEHRATYGTIKALNEHKVPYLVVTKGALVASPEYLDIYDPDLAHFQISVTATDDHVSASYEPGASRVDQRLAAYKELERLGFDVALRVSPLIPGNVDYGKLEGHKCLVEFLRINHWVEEWLPMDYTVWSVKSGGYKHLPLAWKLRELSRIKNFDELSVCEDVPKHFEYFQANVNKNADDCCNLRRADG